MSFLSALPFLAPIRAIKPVIGGFVLLLIVSIVLHIVEMGLLEAVGLQKNLVAEAVSAIFLLLVLLVLLFRLITNPLITHFGNMNGETHGSARFATVKETAALTRNVSGLLIGRDPKSEKLLRYDGPEHLLTMAPTRSGKGV